MAVRQETGKIIEYCFRIRDLCQNELDPNKFSKKLMSILKNLNKIKNEAKLKISIYIFEKSDDL